MTLSEYLETKFTIRVVFTKVDKKQVKFEKLFLPFRNIFLVLCYLKT
jgi:hypothetical protein